MTSAAPAAVSGRRNRPAIVVMGVAGSGKSLVGALLAARLALPFCEGDDLHSAESIAKMKAGRPLDDEDRWPWLDRIGVWIGDHRQGGVVSCSALKRSYRDRLRRYQAPPPAFVLLDPPIAVLERRLARRADHFMPALLLDSQLRTLEPPAPDEFALRLEGVDAPEHLVDAIVAWLGTACTSGIDGPERHGPAD